MDHDICRGCGSFDIVSCAETGDLVCRGCGTVFGERMLDDGPDWRMVEQDDRAGGQQEDHSRVGAAPGGGILDTGHLATAIAGGSGAGNVRNKGSVRALHAAHAFTPAERALLAEFEHIAKLAEVVGLPAVAAESAKHIMKRVRDEKCTPRMSVAAIEAAAIVLACRLHSISRSIHEVVACCPTEARVTVRAVGQCVMAIKQAMPDLAAPAVQLRPVLDKVLGRMALGGVAVIAESVSERIRSVCDSRRLESVVATAVWLTAHLSGADVSMKDAAGAAGVTVDTVKQVYSEIADRVVEQFPPHFLKTCALEGRSVLSLPAARVQVGDGTSTASVASVATSVSCGPVSDEERH